MNEKLIKRYRLPVLDEEWEVRITEEWFGDRTDPAVRVATRVHLLCPREEPYDGLPEQRTVFSTNGPHIQEGDYAELHRRDMANRKAEKAKQPKKYNKCTPVKEPTMQFQFTIDIEVEREQGKFASREEIADQLLAALGDSDPGSITTENEGQYSVSSFDVAEVPQQRKRRSRS